MNLAPMQFPNMPNFTPEQQPGMINIGGRNYGADQLIAANPQVSFAPGVPQMDTVSDGAYAYDATRIPEQPQAYGGGQPMQLGGEAEALPDSLMGIPNPYMQRPVAPAYTQQPAYQAAMAMPQQAIQSLPTLDQFYNPQPAPQPIALVVRSNVRCGHCPVHLAGEPPSMQTHGTNRRSRQPSSHVDASQALPARLV